MAVVCFRIPRDLNKLRHCNKKTAEAYVSDEICSYRFFYILPLNVFGKYVHLDQKLCSKQKVEDLTLALFQNTVSNTRMKWSKYERKLRIHFSWKVLQRYSYESLTFQNFIFWKTIRIWFISKILLQWLFKVALLSMAF